MPLIQIKTQNALLEYWFGPLTGGFADAAHRARWFNGGEAFDATLRDKFGYLVDAVTAGDLEPWRNSERGALAYVLVCDQLPRNIFRGQRRAFATDHLALAAARDAVAGGADVNLALDERSFLYMPFEHSENLLDQHTSVGLFTELRDATPAGNRELTGASLRYAQRHRDIVRRFGRFPHRNAILGRTSSPTEAAFIAEGNSFGQTTKQ